MDSVQLLLNRGGSINANDDCGVRPLHDLLRGHFNTRTWHQEEINPLLERDITILDSWTQWQPSPHMLIPIPGCQAETAVVVGAGADNIAVH